MSNTTKLVSRIIIRGRIEDVWKELTKTDEPIPAVFNAQMKSNGLQPGGQIRMLTPNGRHASVVGEVLAFEPPHRFSHTFKFTHVDEPPCVVTYELREVEDGVEFTLTSDRVPVGTKTEKSMRQGGDWICKVMKQVIERGRPGLGTRVLYGMFKVLGPLMTPKTCRAENWPLSDRPAPAEAAGGA